MADSKETETKTKGKTKMDHTNRFPFVDINGLPVTSMQ